MEYNAPENVIELAKSINTAIDCSTKPLNTIIEQLKGKLENAYKLQGEKSQEIKHLQAELKQLKGEVPIPGSWWKDCPGMAQRTMERVIEKNNEQAAELESSTTNIQSMAKVIVIYQEQLEKLKASLSWN